MSPNSLAYFLQWKKVLPLIAVAAMFVLIAIGIKTILQTKTAIERQEAEMYKAAQESAERLKRMAATPEPTTVLLIHQTPRPNSVPTEADFQGGNNLTYEDFVIISDRVTKEEAGRGLSDRDSLILMAKETAKASKARWLEDGKRWVVRK